LNSNNLIDKNLHKKIVKCYINQKSYDKNEISVIYEDGVQERLWTFNPNKQNFERGEFIGKTKIAAVFHCDRKQFSRNLQALL
jgi:hypothetical protein